MNRIGLFAMLATLMATTAYAQQRYDPAIPRGMSEQQVQPSAELAKPEATPRPPRLVQNEKRHARDSDARHCLDQATNNKGIHRCSLKYRSHASRAAPVRKAAAKPAEPAPAPIVLETPKPPAEAAKGAPPKPADTAKAADLVKPVDVSKAGAVPKPDSAKAPEPAKSAPPAPPAPAGKAPEPAKKP